MSTIHASEDHLAFDNLEVRESGRVGVLGDVNLHGMVPVACPLSRIVQMKCGSESDDQRTSTPTGPNPLTHGIQRLGGVLL